VTVPAELPMTDVMKMVLEAEEHSRHLLEQAESQAAKIAEDARRRAHELVQAKQHETAERAHAMIEAARQEAQRERQMQLDEAAGQIEKMVHLDEAASQALQEAMLRCVNGTT
jgi:vacuolar-type H+-ATPase subunit H